MIKGIEKIYGKFGEFKKDLNNKQTLIIFNTNVGLGIFERYKQNDKLDKIVICCNDWEKRKQ